MSLIKKIFRWVLYPVFGLAVLFITLWLISPWLLTFSSIHNEIKNQVRQISGGDITFDSLSLTLLGNLAGHNITYEKKTPRGMFRFNTSYAQLSSFLTQNSNVYAENLQASIAGLKIADASSVELAIANTWTSPTLNIVLNKGYLFSGNIAAIISATSEEQAKQPTKLDFIKDIQFQNSRVSNPYLITPYTWSGTVIPNGTHGQILSASVSIRPATRDNFNQFANVYVNFNLDHSDQYDLKILAAELPLQLATPVWAQTQLSGRAHWISYATDDYQFSGDVEFKKFQYQNDPLVEIPFARINAETQFTKNYTPKNATMQIVHASSMIQHQQSDLNIDHWVLPAGTISSTIESITAPFSLRWQWDNIANWTIKSPVFPTSSSAPIDLQLELLEQPIDTLLQQIPFSTGDVLAALKGRLKLTANASIANQRLQHYDGTFTLNQGNWPLAVAHLHDSNLTGTIKGNDKEHQLNFGANTSLRLAFDEQRSMELNPERFNAQVTILADPFEVRVAIPTIQTEPLKDATFSYTPPDRWDVKGTIIADDSITDLVANFAPDFPRNLEGMGELQLNAYGTGEQVNINLTSPDLTLYSFDEEPTFGTQLREMLLKTEIAIAKTPIETSLTLTAQHPYLSYDAGDIEWTQDPISMQGTITSSDETLYDITVAPPGNGSIEITSDPSGTFRFELSNTDVTKFAFPVLNQLFLKPESDEPSPIQAIGKLDGWFTLGKDLNLQGEANLRNTHLKYAGPPAFNLIETNMLIPFAYPFDLTHFPSHEISFKAKIMEIENSAYRDINTSFALDASKIVLARDVTVGIFGGELYIDNLEIEDWQDLPAGIEGAFTMEGIQLSQLHSIYPFLPARGEISGNIRNIVYADNQFELNSNLIVQVFKGEIGLQNITIENLFAPQRTIGLEVWLDGIELEELTAYLNYGKMTGQLTGMINNLSMVMPAAGSTEWPKPLYFDIEVKKSGKTIGTINRTALKKIIDLSEQPNIAQALVDREDFFFNELGLKATLRGNELILNGTARNNRFLYADDARRVFNPSLWGSIPVNINFPNDKPIAFNELWRTLQAQVRGTSPPQIDFGN